MYVSSLCSTGTSCCTQGCMPPSVGRAFAGKVRSKMHKATLCIYAPQHGPDTQRRICCRRRAPPRPSPLMSPRLPRPQRRTQHPRPRQQSTSQQTSRLARTALPRSHTPSGRSPPRRACSRRRCPRLQPPQGPAAATPPHPPAAQQHARLDTSRLRPRQPWRQARRRRPRLRRTRAAASA